MDSQKIKFLLDKYYQGETSLEEERILKNYFNQQNSSNKDFADKEILNYFNSDKIVMSSNFTNEIDDIVEKEWKYSTKRRFLKIVKWSSSIAAVLIIAIGVFVFDKVEPPAITDTYKTEDEAYMETKKVLLFISNTMNNKTASLKYLSNVNDSFEKCAQLSKINETLNSIKNENN